MLKNPIYRTLVKILTNQKQMSFTLKGPEKIKEKYNTFLIERKPNGVMTLTLNRIKEFNTQNLDFYDDFVHFFERIEYDREVRVIIILADGKHFCAGIDLKTTAPFIIQPTGEEDQARNSLRFKEKLEVLQKSFQLIEECRWPVLVGVKGACLGGAIDLISACDIIYATKNSKFSIKEIDLSIIADLGTLNRLPILTSNWSILKELALTGENFGYETAKQLGLISKAFDDYETLKVELMKTADMIASKSPVTVIGVKKTLNYARTRQVRRGLEFVKYWNMSQIFTNDLAQSFHAFLNKSKPKFPKL